MLMKKLLFTLLALIATLSLSAQTNLTSGKAVVPLGGLKTYNNGTTDYTISNDNLQKITVDGNTDNVFLFPEGGYDTEANRAIGIQGFYIDLGASKSIGAIKSTWEGADAGANIYVTDTEPAADGTLTGETLIATFTNAQEAAKNVAVSVANSGRYLVFVPTDATNYAWGVKIRTFVALEKEASVLTTLEVSPAVVKVGEVTELTLKALDQVGLEITEGVTFTATNGTLNGNKFTAAAVGDVVITAAYGGKTVSETIKAINVSAPTTNPTEPTDLAANVIAVYSAKYDKGINESNPGWGIGGGAPNPLYTSVEEVEIADGHKVVHVNGTGFNSRTAGSVGVTNDYTSIHVAVYPFTATECKIFGDNAYGSAITKTGLIPGQWNYVVVANEANFPNYVLIELVGETEFYLDHFYFAKPAADDSQAPTLDVAELVKAGVGSVTLKLKATDNLSAQVTYSITDQNNKKYTVKGNSGEEISYIVGGLKPATAYTFTIVALDDNENVSPSKTVNATTAAWTAAATPTEDANNVFALYSDAYTDTHNFSYQVWWDGQAKQEELEPVTGDKVWHISDFLFIGSQHDEVDASQFEKLHIDILPVGENMTLAITPVNTAEDANLYVNTQTLTADQWNAVEISIADFKTAGLSMTRAFQIKMTGANGQYGTGQEFYVDNIYYVKGDGSSVDQPTSGEGSGIIESTIAEVNGKELKYTWAFTQEGSDVTVTFACTNKDDITGINDGYVHDKSNGFAETPGLTKTWTNCTEGQVLKAAHKWEFAGGAFITPDFTYTVQATGDTPVDPFVLTAAPVPTQDAANVLSIYSNAYTPATTYNYGSWGQSTAVATETVGSDDILKLTNYNYLGFEYATDLDISEMTYIHIDVLPMQAMSLGITPIMRGGTTEKSTSVGTLTVKEWNSIDLPIADFGFDLTYKTFQLKIDKGTGNEAVYIDNIYFWKSNDTTPATTYTATFKNSIGWGKVYAYTFNPQTLGEWPGTEMTKNGDVWTISFDATAAPANIIFNNGNGGEGNQTADLVFENGKEYDMGAPVVEPTSGEGTYTIPTGLNAGKELKYTWEFTQSNMDVTVTFACTNKDEIIGMVDGYVFDKTDGFAEREGLTYTWTNCTKGQKITAAHKWMFAEGDFVTPDFTYTVTDAQDTPQEPVVKTVQLLGDWNWDPGVDNVTLTKQGDTNVWTGTLDLSNAIGDQEFKLCINGGGDESDNWAGWLGTNKVNVDAPEDWGSYTDDQDNKNMQLWHGWTGYKTYTITATWTPGENYAEGWSLKIEGKDKADLFVKFVNGKKWEDVYAYTWGVVNVNWPGYKLEKTGTETVNGTEYDVYTWNVPAEATGVPTIVIFSNGKDKTDGGEQTPDLEYVNGKTYYDTVPEAPAVYSIVGELTGGWEADADMTQSTTDPNIYTLEVKAFEATAEGYQYKLRKNHQWGEYEIPASGNYTWNPEEIPATYDLTFTFNLTEGTLTLDAVKQIPPQPSVEYSFDFNNLPAETPVSTSESHAGDITEPLTVTEGSVSMTISSATGATPNCFWKTANGPQLRLYSGTLEFNTADGMTLVGLMFAYDQWNANNAASNGILTDASIASMAIWQAAAEDPKAPALDLKPVQLTFQIAGDTQLNSITYMATKDEFVDNVLALAALVLEADNLVDNAEEGTAKQALQNAIDAAGATGKKAIESNDPAFDAGGQTVTNEELAQAIADLQAAIADFNTATGIERIQLNPVDAVIYDLNGRRVENPSKGIYIQNGRKVVIK